MIGQLHYEPSYLLCLSSSDDTSFLVLLQQGRGPFINIVPGAIIIGRAAVAQLVERRFRKA